MNSLLNNWSNTFEWRRRLDVTRIRMTPIKFIWWRTISVPTRKVASVSFKVTMVLKKGKKYVVNFIEQERK